MEIKKMVDKAHEQFGFGDAMILFLDSICIMNVNIGEACVTDLNRSRAYRSTVVTCTEIMN